MKRVTGLGGVFFKTADPKKTKEWYRDHLGFRVTEWGATFIWGDLDKEKKTISRTEWSPFGENSDYFGQQSFMINYRVHDLVGLLKALQEEGVVMAGDLQEFDYGKFGWIMDDENRKIELWEPIDDMFGDNPPLWTESVTGLGGVFFKSEDPKASRAWYEKHLGITGVFQWNDLSSPDSKTPANTIWSPFKKDTDYFSPSEKPYMFNYRVNDLQTLLTDLRKKGVTIVGKVDEYPYGKFGWILDHENNKIELWEPVDSGFTSA